MDKQKIAALLSSLSPAAVYHAGVRKNSLDQDVTFEIRHGWDIQLANQCDVEWTRSNVEILRFIQQKAGGEEELKEAIADLHLEDAHWRWTGKAIHYCTPEYNWFFWVSDGSVQGACLIYHPKDSAIDGQGIFYIEYVAVAPWNRPNPLASPVYRGVGSDLIRVASKYAVEQLGLRPGFSLHSLPKAAGYYKKLGMVCIPEHKKGTLDYFEMTKESAEALLEVANG